jgi:SAM-dependent methyltransferase
MPDGRSGWNEMAAIYDRTRAFPGEGERIVPLAVADRLRDLGAARVLDLGCGTGRYAVPLAREGIRVVGADRSPEMLAMLASKAGADLVRVVRCDAEALPFRRAFDAVLFAHFLHLVPSLATLARELARVLVPGAHLVLVDTSTGRSPAELRVLAHAMPRLVPDWAPWPEGPVSRSRGQLRELLGHLGADEIDAGPLMTFPARTSLREALGHIRARTWWTCRVHPEEAVARVADLAERRLMEEGADLDAPVEAPVEVRLIVGRVRPG